MLHYRNQVEPVRWLILSFLAATKHKFTRVGTVPNSYDKVREDNARVQRRTNKQLWEPLIAYSVATKYIYAILFTVETLENWNSYN